MELPPRRYMALALLPVFLVLVTIAVLVVYQRSAENRRDAWQKAEAIFNALGARSGTCVAEWAPVDDYFLKRLLGRVGPDGAVSSIRTGAVLAERLRRRYPRVREVNAPPEDLDAILLLRVRASDQSPEDLARIAESSFAALRSTGRMAVIGVAGGQVGGFLQPEELSVVMSAAGFTLHHREKIPPRQFFMVRRSGLEAFLHAGRRDASVSSVCVSRARRT